MKPGTLYQLPFQGLPYQFGGFDATGDNVTWALMKSVAAKSCIMSVEPFTLTHANFVPLMRDGDETKFAVQLRQSTILATSCHGAMDKVDKQGSLFRMGGIPGYKFLSTKGLIWISDIDIKEIKWT